MEIGPPEDQIQSSPPNVWLTSYYGFDPERWGFHGFTLPGQLPTFLRETQPGALVVIYVTKGAPDTDQKTRGRVVGMVQVSHEIGHGADFIDPTLMRKLIADGQESRWQDGVRVLRAWRIVPEEYPTIEQFADQTYFEANSQFLGSQGARLKPHEAAKILDFTVVETSVYGNNKIINAAPAKLSPSKAGPNASHDYFVSIEPEGPKELYIFCLQGNLAHFLGTDETAINNKLLIKVGLSASPEIRRQQFQSALPACAFNWQMLRSTRLDGHQPYSSFETALAGENKLKEFLEEEGKSLGGEFFLAEKSTIENAWFHARRAALAKEPKP